MTTGILLPGDAVAADVLTGSTASSGPGGLGFAGSAKHPPANAYFGPSPLTVVGGGTSYTVSDVNPGEVVVLGVLATSSSLPPSTSGATWTQIDQVADGTSYYGTLWSAVVPSGVTSITITFSTAPTAIIGASVGYVAGTWSGASTGSLAGSSSITVASAPIGVCFVFALSGTIAMQPVSGGNIFTVTGLGSTTFLALAFTNYSGSQEVTLTTTSGGNFYVLAQLT